MVYKTNGMIYSWNYSNQDSIRHLSSILSNYAKNSIGTQVWDSTDYEFVVFAENEVE